MAMDKPREGGRRKKGPWYIGGGIVVAVLITVGLMQLEQAPPTVDGAGVWTDSVRRGPMVRSVRGVGNLEPENIRIIPARVPGRVEQIFARAGTMLEPGTLIVRLSNPDQQLQLSQAQRDLREAQSQLLQLESTLRTQLLSQEGVIAQVQSQYNEAVRTGRTNDELAAKGLVAKNEALRAKDQIAELEKRLDIEKKRLALLESTVDTQLNAQRGTIAQLQTIVALRTTDLESMEVRSASSGVLQSMDLQPGQWVNSGTELARIVEPGKLKAVLRVAEAQMRDVTIGMAAAIDTRNDTIQGRVVRIDPGAVGGTIGIDVAFDVELPSSARPDMSVDGQVFIARLDNVLYVARPNFGNTGQTVGLWVMTKDCKEANRVQVKLGQTSVNHVEILQGLKEGDKVILSDMNQVESADKVRIRDHVCN